MAHNAGYDVIATGAIPVLVGLGYRVTSFFEKGSTYILYFNHQDTGKKLILLSSTNYFAQTLAKLGEVLGVPKLDINYNRADMQTAIAYCMRDVEILKKAVETFIDFIDLDNLGNFGRTVPGQAFNAFRHRFMSHKIMIHNNEQAIAVERGAYYGGRTECFHLGQLPEGKKYYYYDVNSMYPYVMLAFSYPVRLRTVRKHMATEEAARHIKDGSGLCAECIITTDEPIYPVRVNDNLIFPVGTFKTYLSTPEIGHAIDHGHLDHIRNVCLYDMEAIFVQYVDYFYHKRLEAKSQGNKVYDLLYKLFLNSLYGKFGQKSDTWERVGDAPIDLVQVIDVVNGDTGEKVTHKIFGGSEFKQIDEEEAFNSFPAIAAHVTAYARMLLVKYFQCAGWENIFYCDTDSLFTNETGHKNLTEHIDPSRLGALKLEKESEIVKILCPKDYTFGSDTRTKGVRRGSKQLDDHTWETQVWPKLNSFIRSGRLAGYANIKRIKELRRVYTKGWVLTSGKIDPLTLKHENGENYILPYPGPTLTPSKEMIKKYRGAYIGEKTYMVSLDGCDDTTMFKMDLTEEEFNLIERLSIRSLDVSYYNCMPVLKIWLEGQED